jgi:hypothetical protein
VFVAHVDTSLTGFDIVGPLSVNQQRTGKQAEHQMQDGSSAVAGLNKMATFATRG